MPELENQFERSWLVAERTTQRRKRRCERACHERQNKSALRIHPHPATAGGTYGLNVNTSSSSMIWQGIALTIS